MSGICSEKILSRIIYILGNHSLFSGYEGAATTEWSLRPGRWTTFLGFRKGLGTLHCTPRAPVAQLDRVIGFEPVKF